MRDLPGLPGSLAASIIKSGDGSAGSTLISMALMRSMTGVQDLLVLLQDQVDVLRRQQPLQG